jgi:hypothetical protein
MRGLTLCALETCLYVNSSVRVVLRDRLLVLVDNLLVKPVPSAASARR